MQRSTNIAQKRILLIWGSYMGSSKKVRYGKWHGKASSNFSAFQLFHLCLISAISLLMQIIEMFLQGEFSSLMRQNSAKKWMGVDGQKVEKGWKKLAGSNWKAWNSARSSKVCFQFNNDVKVKCVLPSGRIPSICKPNPETLEGDNML